MNATTQNTPQDQSQPGLPGDDAEPLPDEERPEDRNDPKDPATVPSEDDVSLPGNN